MRIPAFFHPEYAPADVPLLARLGVTATKLERLRLVELRTPESLAPEMLAGLHEDTYLQAFLHGTEPMASRQGIAWSPRVRDATLRMLGGQLDAAAAARRGGIAMNVARGFHHALPVCGSGYCPLNGLALLAHAAPDRRVMVIDCDEHGGNGTEEFAAILPNLYNVSIFGTRFGCRGGLRSWAMQVRVREQGFGPYLDALLEVESLVDTHRPDMLVYQAGADCHENDPKSQVGLTTRQMFQRDLTVFRIARERGIPIVFVVAGGYQHADRVARLNANTVRAARWIWRRTASPADTGDARDSPLPPRNA
jgi:acetoin utilization deacetylase AcuC-like enzyme